MGEAQLAGGDSPIEERLLRRSIRDLVAMSAIPAVWSGKQPVDVAEGLADLLLSTLRLAFAYVRLRLPDGGAVEVARVDGHARVEGSAVGEELAPWLDHPGAARFSSNLCGNDVRLAMAPIGVQGSIGLVVVGSRRPDFPTELDRLLLGVAVNQAALREADRLKDHLLAREQVARADAEAERARLSRLFMQAPVAIALSRGMEHMIELANPLYCQMLGRSDLVGKPVRAAFPQFAPDSPHLAILDHVYRSGETFVAQEYHMPLDRRGDGTLEDAVFSFVIEPAKDASGNVYGLMSVAFEITEQVRARLALEWTLSEQSRADDLRRQLLGIVGHDLRSPLSAITMGAATLLKNGQLQGDDTKTAARIARSADRMAKMISQLLDFTRARLGCGMPVEPKPVDLAEVCIQVIAEYETAHPDRELRFGPDPDTNGLWDRDRLAQVAANLIGNAIQHGRPDRPVDVRVFNRGGEVCLSVHNDGPPIPADVLPSIFDPFRRGNVSDRSKTESLGLGLYISRELVLAHGGDISVQSTEGDGTTFQVRLPRNPVGRGEAT